MSKNGNIQTISSKGNNIMEMTSKSYDVTNEIDASHSTKADAQACIQYDAIPMWQKISSGLVMNFWIGPLVVIYWTSTWMLIFDTLVVVDDGYLQIWICAAVGFGLCTVFCITMDLIRKLCTGHGTVWSLVTTRIYIYIAGLATVFQWFSIWEGWTIYTSSSLNNGLITFFSSFGLLALLRVSLTVVAPPCIVAVDSPRKNIFIASTYFSSQDGTWKYCLDSAFTCIVIPFLVVTAWRGLWVATDNLLFPDNVTLSGLYTLVVAYSLALIMFVTRSLWVKLSAWSDGKVWLVKFIIEDFHSLLQSIVCIYQWRGIWVLFDYHFMEPPLRYWIGHAFSYVGLTISCASMCLPAIGCDKDGTMTKGQGVNIDMHYVTHIWAMFKRSK